MRRTRSTRIGMRSRRWTYGRAEVGDPLGTRKMKSNLKVDGRHLKPTMTDKASGKTRSCRKKRGEERKVSEGFSGQCWLSYTLLLYPGVTPERRASACEQLMLKDLFVRSPLREIELLCNSKSCHRMPARATTPVLRRRPGERPVPSHIWHCFL